MVEQQRRHTVRVGSDHVDDCLQQIVKSSGFIVANHLGGLLIDPLAGGCEQALLAAEVIDDVLFGASGAPGNICQRRAEKSFFGKLLERYFSDALAQLTTVAQLGSFRSERCRLG